MPGAFSLSLNLSFSVANTPRHALLMMCLFCEEQCRNGGEIRVFGKSRPVLIIPAKVGSAVGARRCPPLNPERAESLNKRVCKGQPENSSNKRTCVHVLIHMCMCVCSPRGLVPERERGRGP